MEINQTTFAANSITNATQKSENQSSEISSDFETFLKMLTVQLQNQDPLNPVDSSDYALQLATFSSVEQQVKTNDLLSALGQQMGLIGLSELSGWVGMEARVAAPAYFDGEPITVFAEPPATADAAILVVENSAGEEVFRSSIDVTSGSFQWEGNGVDGQPVSAGMYNFKIESYANQALLSTDTAQIYSIVTEAKMDGADLIVVLLGGAEVLANQITAIRDSNL
ncbi:MAG: flagellar hook capping FlgD N-terminal domain-containing protein [Paracoccaceae bacterium]